MEEEVKLVKYSKEPTPEEEKYFKIAEEKFATMQEMLNRSDWEQIHQENGIQMFKRTNEKGISEVKKIVNFKKPAGDVF